MTPAQLLAYETAHPHHGPNKNALIRHELGISEIRYYQLLGHAAVDAAGIAAYPVMAWIVRERGEMRARERSRRTAA